MTPATRTITAPVAPGTTPQPIIKSPGAVLDFAVDFRTHVLEAGEDLDTASAWLITTDGEETPTLEIGDDAHAPSSDADRATVWLRGGTHGVLYHVTCRAPTTTHDPPRTLNDVSFYVIVRDT